MTTNQQQPKPASQELNWQAVYSYFLPEIVEIYQLKYVAYRDDPYFYVPDSQQPYKLNTSRYGIDFWTEVVNEHLTHGASFEDTWNVFMTLNGCGAMPWPDMMRRAPKVFSEQGLYGPSNLNALGAFAFKTSEDAIQQVIAQAENGRYNDHTHLLTFLMKPDQWARLTDPEVRLDIADYLEQFLSAGAAQELESTLGLKVKPFFDWIATGPSRDPQP